MLMVHSPTTGADPQLTAVYAEGKKDKGHCFVLCPSATIYLLLLTFQSLPIIAFKFYPEFLVVISGRDRL